MAVYTEVTDEALEAFLTEYDIGTIVAFRGIAEGVENSNYSLKTTQGDFILTLYEKRVDPADLPWFLGLMEHLARRGLTCPQPVRARDGDALRVLADRHAAITTFLPGVWPRRVRVEHCGPVGRALAELHVAGADFAPRRVNALGAPGWRPLLERCKARADEVQPTLAAELDTALTEILAAWPAALPEGELTRLTDDVIGALTISLENSPSGLFGYNLPSPTLWMADLRTSSLFNNSICEFTKTESVP